MTSVGALFAWEAAAAGIATVTDVVNEGYRKPPGATEQKATPTDELVQDEALRTGNESSIAVKFADGSELSVESLSEVVLSDYLFDAEQAAATGVINLNVGLFRFSSSDLPDSGLQLKTPVATIGIRGTEFLVTVTNEKTIVDIVDGLVEVAPVGRGKAKTCEGGQSILVSGADTDAVCGDFGSFSTAAGPPPDTQQANSNPDGGEPKGGPSPDRPERGARSGGPTGGGDPGPSDPGPSDPGPNDPGPGKDPHDGEKGEHGERGEHGEHGEHGGGGEHGEHGGHGGH